MEDNRITFYYDFSNSKNSGYSMEMFAHLIGAEVGFRCIPTETLIDPEIQIDSPTKGRSGYRGAFLDSPEILENLKRDILEIKAMSQG
jgi:hypothetical protein